MLHDGVRYDPVQGKSQVPRPSKLEIILLLKSLFCRLQFELASD